MSDGTTCAPPSVNRFAWERLLKASDAEPLTKLVGLALATYANRDGTNAYPGVKRLMADCSVSNKTVRRHLGYLRNRGLILCVYHASHGGISGYADRYHLTDPGVSHEAPGSPQGGPRVAGDPPPTKTMHSSNHSARLALAHDKSRADTAQQPEDLREDITERLEAWATINYDSGLDPEDHRLIEALVDEGRHPRMIENMVKKRITEFESVWPTPEVVHRDWAASAECPF